MFSFYASCGLSAHLPLSATDTDPDDERAPSLRVAMETIVDPECCCAASTLHVETIVSEETEADEES